MVRTDPALLPVLRPWFCESLGQWAGTRPLHATQPLHSLQSRVLQLRTHAGASCHGSRSLAPQPGTPPSRAASDSGAAERRLVMC